MILACPVKNKDKSRTLCDAFVQGAPKDARGFVFYGVNETNMRDWLIAQKSGQPWFYMDGAFFDCVRGSQFRVAKNRIQIDASAHRSNGKRFARLGIEVKTMRTFTGHCLAVEQSPSFMRDIAADEKWLTKRMQQTRDVGVFDVRHRTWSSAKLGLAQSLQADLADAAFVLTHSSAAAVEALLAGVHIQVSTMSALRGVDEFSRLRAFNVLADGQFSVDEIKSGKAWSWLNP